MKQTGIILLVCLNLIGTAIFGTLLFQNQSISQNSAPQPDVPAEIDLEALEKPLAQITTEISKLNETVQRFSTSSVQYDFLKREMDQLAVIDQTIGAQAQATLAAKTEENAEAIDADVAKLSKLSQQVKGQLQARRKTMLQLIAGLEKELAELSGSLPQKIQPKPEIAIPPATAPPATVPESE